MKRIQGLLPTLALLLLQQGCAPQEEGSAAEAHLHEEAAIGITVWTEAHEVFMEHPLLVAGAGAVFVTHVTDMETFEPRREGPITFVFGDDELRHVAAEPARAGIYLPEIRLPRTGSWKLAILVPLEDGEDKVEMGELKVYASPQEAAAAPVPEEPEGISFLKEQQWKLGTRTAIASVRELTERLRVPGSVTALPERRAVLRSPVSGRLRPPEGEGFPGLGARVEAGQTIVRVEPPVSDLPVSIVRATAGVERARLILEHSEKLRDRIRMLVRDDARSRRDLEEAELAVRKARIELQSAEAIHRSYEQAGAVASPPRDGPGGSPIVNVPAPISGVLTRMYVTPGEQVEAGRSLCEILDDSEARIEAGIPEVDAHRVPPAPEALVEIAGGDVLRLPGAGPGDRVHKAPVVDPDTHAVRIFYDTANSDGMLTVGMTVRMEIETLHREEALAVPLAALIEDEGRQVVFVQVAGETFEKRDVVVGIRDGDLAEIRSGLEAGERVATHGAFAIRLASLSSSIPAHGHTH